MTIVNPGMVDLLRELLAEYWPAYRPTARQLDMVIAKIGQRAWGSLHDLLRSHFYDNPDSRRPKWGEVIAAARTAKRPIGQQHTDEDLSEVGEIKAWWESWRNDVKHSLVAWAFEILDYAAMQPGSVMLADWRGWHDAWRLMLDFYNRLQGRPNTRPLAVRSAQVRDYYGLVASLRTFGKESERQRSDWMTHLERDAELCGYSLEDSGHE